MAGIDDQASGAVDKYWGHQAVALGTRDRYGSLF